MVLTIKNTGQEIKLNEGETLLDVLRREGIPIRSSCGGFASCGNCVVLMKSESKNLNEPNFEEKKLLGNVFHITKERLSCQVKVSESDHSDSVTVEIVHLD